MKQFKGVGIGAGYFSPFQYEARQRIPEVQITELCNHDTKKAGPLMKKFRRVTYYAFENNQF